MTIKAVCCMTSILRDSDDHTHFVAGVSYAVVTDDSISGTHYIYDLNPSALATTLTDTIQSAMKTYLTGQGVSFGLLDSVRLLPGLV